jgi:hypothetical protein
MSVDVDNWSAHLVGSCGYIRDFSLGQLWASFYVLYLMCRSPTTFRHVPGG